MTTAKPTPRQLQAVSECADSWEPDAWAEIGYARPPTEAELATLTRDAAQRILVHFNHLESAKRPKEPSRPKPPRHSSKTQRRRYARVPR